MSSCPKNESELISAEEVRSNREEEIVSVSKSFFSQVIDNLCIMEGMSGHIDNALEIDRRKLILKALKELVKDMEEQYES